MKSLRLTHQRNRLGRFIQYEIDGRLIQRPFGCDDPNIRDIFLRLSALTQDMFSDNVHGWIPRHSVQTAAFDIACRHGRRLSFDIVDFFGSIDQVRLAHKVNRLDATLWPQIVPYLPSRGIPTGFRFSPLLGNLYLREIDQRFPIVRYADNIMIVSDDPERVFLKARRHLSDLDLICHKVELDPVFFCKQPLPKARMKGAQHQPVSRP